MQDDPYKALAEKLHEFDWPADYMFKFIVPDDHEREIQVVQLFEGLQPQKFEKKQSKKGAYASFTIVVRMLNPNKVIAVYRNAEKIKNLISL